MHITFNNIKFSALALSLALFGIISFCFISISKAETAIDKKNTVMVEMNKADLLYQKKYGIIRNPYDQRFDPKTFDFEFYEVNDCSMREILAKLFQPGTKKKFVEEVLIKIGGPIKRSLPST